AGTTGARSGSASSASRPPRPGRSVRLRAGGRLPRRTPRTRGRESKWFLHGGCVPAPVLPGRPGVGTTDKWDKGVNMPPKKKVAALVKVQLQAGAATPAPPVGTALGPHGVNIMDFCKQYNAATESQRGNVVPVEITIYEDRSFSFVTKTPPAAQLIMKAAGVEKGSGEPHKNKVGSITAEQVREIAQTKMPDLNAK